MLLLQSQRAGLHLVAELDGYPKSCLNPELKLLLDAGSLASRSLVPHSPILDLFGHAINVSLVEPFPAPTCTFLRSDPKVLISYLKPHH